MVVVEVEGVSKRFRRQTVQPFTTVKTAFVDFVLRQQRHEREATYQALRDISLTVRQGKVVGLIGRNGSGKSTLLKLLTGIYRPDSGKIAVHGKVGALLELGAGFHPEFSGRENIFINGIVLGLSKRDIRQRFDEIVRFAELEEFIDEPVKTYSSGMSTRLGFSVAVHAEPDILFIDEVLAVGDESFRQKCFEKIDDFRGRGKTIILVSHDLGAIQRWCDDVLWLEEGTLRERGMPRRVIDLYRQSIATQQAVDSVAEHRRIEAEVHQNATTEAGQRWGSREIEAEVHQNATAEAGQRWGSREIEIISVTMRHSSGQESYVYQSGESTHVVMHYRVHRPVPNAVFGIAILRGDGVLCYGTNTDIDGLPIPHLGGEGEVKVLLERLDLMTGTYVLDVAIHAIDGYPYDYHHGLYSFAVKSELQDSGVSRIPHAWVIKPFATVS